MSCFRVTCLLGFSTDDTSQRGFATRQQFPTREQAEAYADTIDKSRVPWVGYQRLTTELTPIGWSVYDADQIDGTEDSEVWNSGEDELRSLFEFCELYYKCTVPIYGLPCGGKHSASDEAGSGYLRCDGCGML